MMLNGRQKGFTLLEMLLAMGIFVILVSIASATFVQTLRTQRAVTSLNQSLNNAALVIEQMAREARTGSAFNDVSGEVSVLNFTNVNGEEVSYKMINGFADGKSFSAIGRCVGGPSVCQSDANYKPLTAPSVAVDNLKFILQGTRAGDGFPPRIIVILSLKGGAGEKINLQTAVSARNLDT